MSTMLAAVLHDFNDLRVEKIPRPHPVDNADVLVEIRACGICATDFKAVRGIYARRDHVFARSYVRWLVPDRWAEPSVLERLRAESAAVGDSDELLRRQLDEIGDDLERVIRVQARFVESV